jgi:hypothetical protein
MASMAVEDHPLFPKWKARLEELLAAKTALDALDGASHGASRQAVARYDAALYAYNKISEEI